MDKLITSYNSGKMSFEQLSGNSQVLIAAGSETTATLMSGQSPSTVKSRVDLKY